MRHKIGRPEILQDFAGFGCENFPKIMCLLVWESGAWMSRTGSERIKGDRISGL